jgi:hypothetical protein
VRLQHPLPADATAIARRRVGGGGRCSRSAAPSLFSNDERPAVGGPLGGDKALRPLDHIQILAGWPAARCQPDRAIGPTVRRRRRRA